MFTYMAVTAFIFSVFNLIFVFILLKITLGHSKMILILSEAVKDLLKDSIGNAIFEKEDKE